MGLPTAREPTTTKENFSERGTGVPTKESKERAITQGKTERKTKEKQRRNKEDRIRTGPPGPL